MLGGFLLSFWSIRPKKGGKVEKRAIHTPGMQDGIARVSRYLLLLKSQLRIKIKTVPPAGYTTQGHDIKCSGLELKVRDKGNLS